MNALRSPSAGSANRSRGQEVRWPGGTARFEIDPEIKHRLLNGLDDVGADARSGGRDRLLRARPRASGPVTTALMSGARDWDAATYDRVSATRSWCGHSSSSTRVAPGDEVVLDAGCGSGRVTALLVRPRTTRTRVRGRSGAVDGRARSRGARRPRRRPVPGPGRARPARARRRDLLECHLPLDPRPRGAVRGTAPHAQARRAARRPVRRRGNIDAFRTLADEVAGEEPSRRYFADWKRPWNYATAQTRLALGAAGFRRYFLLA